MKSMYWHQVPRSVIKALPAFVWNSTGTGSAGRDTAALMVYVALLFSREEEVREVPAMTYAEALKQDVPGPTVIPTSHLWNGSMPPWAAPPASIHVAPSPAYAPPPPLAATTISVNVHVARTSYDDLAVATGLSRSMIRQALERLTELKLITPCGSSQTRSYEISWGTTGWFKLPCRAIVKSGEIKPFTHFSLRSKRELHAMKLYLYLASVIGRGKTYAEASYEKIHERIGVSERDIRRAIAMLIGVGLLRNVQRENGGLNTSYGANKYYLVGDVDLYGATPPQAAVDTFA